MRNVVYKCILIVIFVIIIINLSCCISEGKLLTWKVKDLKEIDNKFIVFNFEIDSSIASPYLTYDEFIKGDIINGWYFQILYLSEGLEFESVEITLTTSNEEEYQFTISENKIGKYEDGSYRSIRITPDIFPNQFNESGKWFIEFDFDHNERALAFEYPGTYFSFNDDSKVRGNTPLMYGVYKKGYTIYSQTELLQLRAAKATEETANIYRLSLIFLAATALATALGASVSYYHVKQMLLTRRVDGIKHMILNALDKITIEFKNLEFILNEIKEGHILDFSYGINSFTMKTISWKDFKSELPNEFKEIKNYIELKDKYRNLRTNIKKFIIELINLKRTEINNSYNFLTKLRKKYGIKETPVVFFKEIISNELAENILTIEIKGASYTKELFKEFKNEWLEIRNDKRLDKSFKELDKLAKEIEEYCNFSKKLEETKESLFKKYNLMEWELYEHKKMLEDEGYQTEYEYGDLYQYLTKFP